MTVLRVDTIAGTGTTFGPLLDGNLEFNSQNYIVLPKGSSNQQGVLRTTEDVIGVGGTYYDNLVLAMPFNEATGLRDVSSRNRNPGTYGNVSISSTISKYYGSSAKFDGSGDYLDFEKVGFTSITSAEAFTIETYVYFNDLDNYSTLFASSDRSFTTDGFKLEINNNKLRVQANSFQHNSGTTLSTGQWYHFSFSRTSNGNAYSFVNGILDNSTTDNSATFQITWPKNILIGEKADGGENLNGYLQDLRIYKGIAKYTANFTPPERIAETGVGFKTGALRYNTDSNKPELYDGNQWTELQISNVGLGTDGDTGPGARGVFGGGFAPPSNQNVIDYINISSTGNAQDFGDLTYSTGALASLASNTRGIFAGGYGSPVFSAQIDFITISSTGNATDFGVDLPSATSDTAGCSNSTRGLIGGGLSPGVSNVINYITISSTGLIADFGDLTVARSYFSACASPTRGVWTAGNPGSSPNFSNIIDYITISTLGDAQDFGDLTAALNGVGSCSNATRGLIGGGYTPTLSNIVQYVTIATTGNSTNFGNLTQSRRGAGACSSSTRGVWGGGYASPDSNTIDYVTILTQGNAVDFGDLFNSARRNIGGCSNAHGGL